MKKLPIDSLRFENMTFVHEGSSPILNNVDFELPMNQIIWVKAEEGEGKSSFLQLLAGLQLPQSGKYLLNGEDVMDMSFEEFLPYRLNIGFSFDYGGLIHNRTIYDNLALPLLYHKLVNPEVVKKRVNDIIKALKIDKYAQERPAHVPGRVRKIACIARSLVIYPDMLLLDDPSVGIGQEASEIFSDYIHKLRAAGCLKHIFMCSYDEKFMNQFDYQILHLSQGNLYYQEVDQTKKVVSL